MLLRTLAFSMVIGASLTGCDVDEDTARTRAANEFACPSNKLEVRTLSDHTYEISGCGSRATYTCVANHRAFQPIGWSCMKEK